MTTSTKTGQKRGNNEGTIRQRPNGGWESRLTLPDGRRKSLYGKTRAEVAKKLTAAQRDVQQGIPLPEGRQTVAQFMVDWLENVARPRVRATTYERYHHDVRDICASLGRLKLTEITPQRVQAFLNGLSAAGKSPATVTHRRAVLRSALTQAENWNLIARNPAAGKRVSVPRIVRPDVPALSEDEARAILAAFQGHAFENLVYIALATGMRVGELRGLRWQDVDIDAGTITVRYQLQRIGGKQTLTEPKSKQSRRVLALGTGAVDALRAERVRQMEQRLRAGPLWKDSSHVFTSEVGTPLDGPNVTHRFQQRLADAGLPRMRVHDLRHGVATLMLAQGENLRTVMEQLGHAQIGLTMNTYAHISPALKRDAAARLDATLAGSGLG